MSAAASPLGLFERYLSVWVFLAILAGLALGLVAPDAISAMAGFEYASVNLVVAVLIWAAFGPSNQGPKIPFYPKAGRRAAGLEIGCVDHVGLRIGFLVYRAP